MFREVGRTLLTIVKTKTPTEETGEGATKRNEKEREGTLGQTLPGNSKRITKRVGVCDDRWWQQARFGIPDCSGLSFG